ncbi:MAG: DUF362 domain-containing protein [candidate division KSB1 bacterium]|nr:DUF362 domain-containing protein [candidate division KSB1 bacterium]
MSTRRSVDRREFLKQTSLLVVGSSLALAGRSETHEAKVKRARVVLVRDREAVDADGKPRGEVIQHMLDDAVMALTGKGSATEAWAVLVSPKDTVGIKTNVWAPLPTPAEVEQALVRRIREAGVPQDKIAIRDRGVFGDPHFEKATALFNARPLRTHYWAGIGGCLKNYIPFVPRPYEYHPDECADLAAIWKLHRLRERTRLNVLVALTPLFYGRGPHHFDRKYTWPYCGLFVSTDPVAVDALGARLLQLKRLAFFGEDRPLDTTPKHVVLADSRHGIGCADLEQIELIRLGWMEESLL